MTPFKRARMIWTVQSRIFTALVLRFVIGRYGRDNIGFLWTIAEPMILCLGVMVIWSSMKGGSEHGLNLVAFVFTAYMPLTLWRHQTGLMVNILRSVKFLTIFRDVTLYNTIVARLILDFVSVSAAAIIVYVALHFGAGILNEPYDFGLMMEGWFLMALIASGAGLLIASVSEMTDIVEKVMQPMQYFLLPVSGCFYMVEWLPDYVKEYALYMPLLHPYEMIRAGYFGPVSPTHYDVFYGISWGLIMMGLGFFVFERVKNHVEA